MTCVVGLLHEGVVYMGADSAGVSGYDLTIRRDAKVFVRGPLMFGYTTSFRMGQLLRYRLSLPEHPDGMDPFEWLATSFVDAARDCLKAGGFAKKENEAESGGDFLVGYAGRLYTISSDYQVGESLLPFAAVGCGAAYALGALHALWRPEADPRATIRAALEAAEAFSIGVRKPFAVEVLSP